MIKLNQKGAVDLLLIAALVLVLAIGGIAYWRISSSQDDSLANIEDVEEIEEVASLPADLEGIKSIEEIEVIAGVNDEIGLVGFVLETKDNYHVYIVTLSNGKKLTIHATTGEVLSEEEGEVLVGDKLAMARSITMSAAEAYAQASAMSLSDVAQIELEIEDDKATYKIEFKDGSKVELDAVSGAVVKSEIKDESYESESSEHEEDEYEEPEEEEAHEEDEYEEPEEEEAHEEDESNS